MVLKTLLSFLIVSFLFFTPNVSACHNSGQPIPKGQPFHEPNKPPNPKLGECPPGLDQIEGVVKNVLSVIVGLAFVAMLVMLLIAGIRYLTSAGEPKAVQSAHNTVTWALLGIVFMAIAWLILQLVKTFTGIDVTIFNIKALPPFSS